MFLGYDALARAKTSGLTCPAIFSEQFIELLTIALELIRVILIVESHVQGHAASTALLESSQHRHAQTQTQLPVLLAGGLL